MVFLYVGLSYVWILYARLLHKVLQYILAVYGAFKIAHLKAITSFLSPVYVFAIDYKRHFATIAFITVCIFCSFILKWLIF